MPAPVLLKSTLPPPATVDSDSTSSTDDCLGSITDPLAARLRLATAKAHEEVQQPRIVSELVTGTLPLPVHTRYLLSLYELYTALEIALEDSVPHPILSTVSNPALLARAPHLEADLSYYLDAARDDWGDQWDQVRNEKKSLHSYTSRIKHLAANEDERYLLLAHSYVRYLGDLSGGQSIVRSIRKSYALPPSGEGSAFYQFFLDESSPFFTSSSSSSAFSDLQPANPNQLKAIKAWFRSGLNEAGSSMSEEQRLNVIEEARRAYEYNIGLFKDLQEWSDLWSGSATGEQGTELPKTNGHAIGAETSKRSGNEWISIILVAVFGALVSYIVARDFV